MTCYYLYTLNEASLGLYFGQFNFKKEVKEMFDVQCQMDKDGVVEGLNKYKGLAKTMERETKELGELKEDWAKSMAEKMVQLLK
jgi:hypothetical protein